MKPTRLFALAALLCCLLQGLSAQQVTLKGTPVHLSGTLPATGTQAPDFTAVNSRMQDVTLQSLRGKQVILNIFPSLDTPTCARSVREFNEIASTLPGTVVLCLSMDLPFAQNRFCSTEGLDNVMPLSVFRNPEFARAYGVLQTDGPSRGLLARAVVVISPEGKIVFTQLVKELSQEPDYEAVLRHVSK